MLLDSTFFWRDCKFTAIKDSSHNVAGYEATCKCVGHGKTCRRTSAHGGSDMVLLKLKWWLLQASQHATRNEHVKNCPHSFPGRMPTAAEFETMDFGL